MEGNHNERKSVRHRGEGPEPLKVSQHGLAGFLLVQTRFSTTHGGSRVQGRVQTQGPGLRCLVDVSTARCSVSRGGVHSRAASDGALPVGAHLPGRRRRGHAGRARPHHMVHRAKTQHQGPTQLTATPGGRVQGRIQGRIHDPVRGLGAPNVTRKSKTVWSC